MQDATHDNDQHQSPDGVLPERATYISRRPSWANVTRVGSEEISHSYTASIVAVSIEELGTCPAPVELCRDDALFVGPEGVWLDPGEPRVFLLDTWFDLDNARLLSKALLEVCNRFEDWSYDHAAQAGGEESAEAQR